MKDRSPFKSIKSSKWKENYTNDCECINARIEYNKCSIFSNNNIQFIKIDLLLLTITVYKKSVQ